jgi:C4-dicarboxylate-specific signal transduction histidine kinase
MGWPKSALIDRAHFDDLSDTGTLRDFLLRLYRDGQTTREWRLRQPDGSWRILQTNAHVLTRRPDGIAEVVGYTVDVTKARETEARAMVAARLASLGEMTAGLAHEIRQPLQAISLAAEVAQIAASTGDAERLEKRLARIVDETGRTSDLIDRLRRFARGADDGAQAEAVPLAAVVEGALAMVHPALRDALVAVDMALADPAPVVSGHPLLLEQVLSNLLLNARDALMTRPATMPRRVRIASAPGKDGMVALTVADTGGGIAPEVINRLFEPFVTTKGPDKGTGLGLSICHGLVKGMGGRIEAHNDAEGAVFTISLVSAGAPSGATMMTA